MDKKDANKVYVIEEQMLLQVLNSLALAPYQYVHIAINLLSNLKQLELKKEETE